MSINGQVWRKRNPEKFAALHKRHRDKLRNDAIEAYGGKCACCGESHREFLHLDHVNGGGNIERRKVLGQSVGGSTVIYRKAKKEGYPPTYRLLCANCNHSYGCYGYCPHQQEDK